MNPILNNMIEKLYNRIIGSFVDSRISQNSLILNKCFISLDTIINAEEYHLENANETLRANIPSYINKKVSMDKLASYIAGDEDKTYILKKLKEFDNVTHDKISSLLLLNIDLLATNKINGNILARLDTAIDSLCDEIALSQKFFEPSISLKENLDNVTNYLKKCKDVNNEQYLSYTNVLNSLLSKLTTIDLRDIEDNTWLSINDDFSLNKTNPTINNDTEDHGFNEITKIIYNTLKNNNLFDNIDKNYFNDYQYVLNLIKDNYDTLINEIEDEKNFNNNLSENQKEFISLVTTALLTRELSSTTQIDKSNLFANNLSLLTKKSYFKIQDEISDKKEMVDLMENILRKSLKIANKINNKEFNKDINDYEELLLNIQRPVKIVKEASLPTQQTIIKTSNKELKPKTQKKYISNVLENLVKIIYEKNKAYEKELAYLNSINLNKNIKNYKKELVVEYALKYLDERDKKYLSHEYGISFNDKNTPSIDFSNKTQVNEIVEMTKDSIKNEKAQFSNYLNLLDKKMLTQITNDIITSSNKKSFIDKFNNMLDLNVTDRYTNLYTNVMNELYDLTSSLVEPVIKNTVIPYKFINPKDILKTIIDDTKKQNSKYPNLFNLVKFSQKLDKNSALNSISIQLKEMKDTLEKANPDSINKIIKIETLIENPITSKQEREDIKDMIKNLANDIKNSKDNDFKGNKVEIVNNLTNLSKVLNSVKFENPKDFLINKIKKLNNEEILKQFETDLSQLSISNKEYTKNKYILPLIENKLSKKEVEDFNREFDTIAIISQNEKNKKSLKDNISTQLQEYITNNNILDLDKQYLLQELSKKASIIIDNEFKVKSFNKKNILKLKDTIGILFNSDDNITKNLNKEIDKSVQDIELAKISLQNVSLIQKIKNVLFKFNIDPKISKKIIEKLKDVKTNQEKEEIINEYKPVFTNEKDFKKFYDMVNELNIAEFDIVDYQID